MKMKWLFESQNRLTTLVKESAAIAVESKVNIFSVTEKGKKSIIVFIFSTKHCKA